MGPIKEKARRRAVFPALSRPGIVAAAVLNFRVRDGNGCDHRAIATGLLLPRGNPGRECSLNTGCYATRPSENASLRGFDSLLTFFVGEIKTLGPLVPVS